MFGAIVHANGVAMSADGNTIYLSDTRRQPVVVFDVERAARREFDLSAHGHPDGMALDENGALWVALVVRRNTRNPWARGLSWVYAVMMAAVVIGTGNHWVLDVAVGWALVILAMWLTGSFSNRTSSSAIEGTFPRIYYVAHGLARDHPVEGLVDLIEG